MDSMGSMTTSMPPGSTASGTMTSSSGGMQGMEMSCKISMLWNWDTIDACFLASSWHIRSKGMFAGSCIGAVCLVLCLEFLRRVGREYDAFILRRARLRRLYLSGPVSALSTQVKSNSNHYQSIDPVENGSRTGGCERCCCAEDDLITPAPVSSEESSTTQQKIPQMDTKDTPLNNQVVNAGPAMLEPYRPSPVEQVLRAILHMLQFAVAYIIMLLAMYFNGYIIICIFLGAFLGSLIFSWEPVSLNKENDATQVTKCCD